MSDIGKNALFVIALIIGLLVVIGIIYMIVKKTTSDNFQSTGQYWAYETKNDNYDKYKN